MKTFQGRLILTVIHTPDYRQSNALLSTETVDRKVNAYNAATTQNITTAGIYKYKQSTCKQSTSLKQAIHVKS